MKRMALSDVSGLPPKQFQRVLAAARVEGEWLVVEKRMAAQLMRPRLGDRIERLLRPLVRCSDLWLGTRLAGCAGCARRKEWLNQVLESLILTRCEGAANL